MCGIVGAIANRNITPILVEGLKRLEYRGYDSAGVAVYSAEEKRVHRVRRRGKVAELEQALTHEKTEGFLGIAHTRWATHGAPSETNAHPHVSGDRVCIVHNGIIENYATLKKQLIAQGYVFSSETDTEVIAHLIESFYQNNCTLLFAVTEALKQLEGAFALGVIAAAEPDVLITARKGSPLVIGVGEGENFIASDQLALLPVTNRFIYVEEETVAQITKDKIELFDAQGHSVEAEIITFDGSEDDADKGPYQHYMLKEIYEQPIAICSTLEGRILQERLADNTFSAKSEILFQQVKLVQIVACGTSYHAGLVARYWFESIAGIPCQVEIASEFRYRQVVVQPNTLFVTISQSGETADTLAALRRAKQQNYVGTLTVCNVLSSSLVRESDIAVMTQAGTEIGVASTKAFTTQLVALSLLMLAVGKYHRVNKATEKYWVDALRKLPAHIEAVLALETKIETLANYFGDKHHALFLGRGALYPVAMEGALKLKEISYIHAEAYAAGELKHGPLALVDSDMPIVAVAPYDALLDKLKSNLHEVKARGGKLVIFADERADFKEEEGVFVINLPAMNDELTPILYTIPLQLLSYHVALIKGTDVDQPRNLAKSVTVE